MKKNLPTTCVLIHLFGPEKPAEMLQSHLLLFFCVLSAAFRGLAFFSEGDACCHRASVGPWFHPDGL